MSRRDEILAKIKGVPSIPAGAFQVLRLLQDPEVDVARLTKTIEYDPGLTTNLLRMANSALFGAPRSIGSVREAIVRLGINNLRKMLGPMAVAPVVRKPLRGYDLPAGALLDHAVAVAVGVDALARELRIAAPRETFTAALLHDIGKILLGTFIEVDADEIRKAAFDGKISFERAEEAVLGIDHAEAGAVLLESWNCPAEIAAVARWHHRPDEAPEGGNAIRLVHIADAISMMQGIGAGSDGLNYRMSDATVGCLKLTDETVELVAYRMVSELTEMRNVLCKVS